jgi:hypothetical protein
VRGGREEGVKLEIAGDQWDSRQLARVGKLRQEVLSVVRS